MVTEYNKYLLNKRRMEERAKNASSIVANEEKKDVSEPTVSEVPKEDVPTVEKKTDAEKIRRGRKKAE